MLGHSSKVRKNQTTGRLTIQLLTIPLAPAAVSAATFSASLNPFSASFSWAAEKFASFSALHRFAKSAGNLLPNVDEVYTQLFGGDA